MKDVYIDYINRRKIKSAAIDRIWAETEATCVEFRNKLFPFGKPGVIWFVLVLRAYLYWSVAKRTFNIIVFDRDY